MAESAGFPIYLDALDALNLSATPDAASRDSGSESELGTLQRRRAQLDARRAELDAGVELGSPVPDGRASSATSSNRASALLTTIIRTAAATQAEWAEMGPSVAQRHATASALRAAAAAMEETFQLEEAGERAVMAPVVFAIDGVREAILERLDYRSLCLCAAVSGAWRGSSAYLSERRWGVLDVDVREGVGCPG